MKKNKELRGFGYSDCEIRTARCWFSDSVECLSNHDENVFAYFESIAGSSESLKSDILRNLEKLNNIFSITGDKDISELILKVKKSEIFPEDKAKD